MRRPLVLAAGSLLLLAGCGEAEVSTGDLEREVITQLEQSVEAEIKAVDCEEPLPAEVDASVRCVLTAPDDTQIGLTVTTTSIEGDNVRFGVQVDQEPIG